MPSMPWAAIICWSRTTRAWICDFSQVRVSVRPAPLASRKNWRWPGWPTAAIAIWSTGSSSKMGISERLPGCGFGAVGLGNKNRS